MGVDTFWGLIRGFRHLMVEADRAVTFDELRDAGERFGKVMGRNAARAFVMLATAAIGSTGATLGAKLPGLPGAAQAAVRAEAQAGMVYAAVGQVEAVAVAADGFVIGLAPGAVAMSSSGTRGGGGSSTGYREWQTHGGLYKGRGSAGQGKEWHHIVEQTEGNVRQFGPGAIHNTENVIPLDKGLHDQVSALYSRKATYITGSTDQEVQVDPLALHNFRTPSLDLDCVYGRGPGDQPYLYRLPPDDALFITGFTNSATPNGDPKVLPSLPFDLPRGAQGLAIIGDPRNDENLIVAQLHLAFLRFHNKVVEGLRNGTVAPPPAATQISLFEQARKLVTWHYQWIVLHDFLRRVVAPEVLDDVLERGRLFYVPKVDAFIPVEFSAAAYRLGHSMVREVYDFNEVFTPRPSPRQAAPATLGLLFTFSGRSGTGVPIPSDWIIDWRRFFKFPNDGVTAGLSRKIDPFLVPTLSEIPDHGELPGVNLPIANLKRGRSLGLPSGQNVARRMRIEPLSPRDIAKGPDGAVAAKHNLHLETPLWYYVLKEAEQRGHSKHLGPVGSRILSEVFVGLLELDSGSFLSSNPQWRPTLPSARSGEFTMTDLLSFAGDLSPINDPRNLKP